MFACCSNCYQKYLNENGVIDDKSNLSDIFGTNEYQIIKNEKNNIIIKFNLTEIKLCSCACHIKGVAIMH